MASNNPGWPSVPPSLGAARRGSLGLEEVDRPSDLAVSLPFAIAHHS